MKNAKTIEEVEAEIRAAVAAAQTKMQEVEAEIRAAVAAAQTKMQEVETEIRAAVAAAQALGSLVERTRAQIAPGAPPDDPPARRG